MVSLFSKRFKAIFCVFVFFSGICEILRLYFLRKKQFKAISSRTVIISLTTVVLNLFCGYLFYSNKVLISSTTIAQSVAFLLFIFLFIRLYGKTIKQVKIKSFKNIIKKYWQFPTFMMTGKLLNSLTYNVPILVLSGYYSMSELGQYAFVNKIVNVPFAVIISALTQTFLQKFINTSEKQRLKIYVKTTGILFCIILLPAIICVIFAPVLFRTIFGITWEPAAIIAQILAPMLIIRFALTPVEGAAIIAQEKIWLYFLMEVVRFICVGISVLLSITMHFSFEKAIFSYSMGLASYYILYFLWEVIILRMREKALLHSEQKSEEV